MIEEIGSYNSNRQNYSNTMKMGHPRPLCCLFVFSVQYNNL